MKVYSNDGGNTWEGPFSENEIESLTLAGVISSRTIFREDGARMRPEPMVEPVGIPVGAPQPQSPQQTLPSAYTAIPTAPPVMPQAMTALPTVPPAMVPQPVTRQFYIARADGTQVGPVPESTLLASYCSGNYPPSTLVYTESQGGWLPLSQVLGGAAMLGAHASAPMRQAPRKFEPFSAFAHMTFTGRARRSEFWSYFLMLLLLRTALYVLLGPTDVFNIVWGICAIINLLPFLMIACRRLHDIGLSGWWQLLFLTGIGIPILFVQWCFDSEKCTNKYGPSPKYRN